MIFRIIFYFPSYFSTLFLKWNSEDAWETPKQWFVSQEIQQVNRNKVISQYLYYGLLGCDSIVQLMATSILEEQAAFICLIESGFTSTLKMKQQVPLKHLYLSTILHSVTSQKSIILICHIFTSKWRQQVSLKSWRPPTRLHSVIKKLTQFEFSLYYWFLVIISAAGKHYILGKQIFYVIFMVL